MRTEAATTGTIYEGDSVTYTCGAGYKAAQSTLTCSAGVLTGDSLTCVPVCAAAPVATTPADGSAPTISYSAADYVSGTVATATWCARFHCLLRMRSQGLPTASAW